MLAKVNRDFRLSGRENLCDALAHLLHKTIVN